MVTPDSAAICFSTVTHKRFVPTEHKFSYPLNQVWIDPDDPTELCSHHRLWSSSRYTPAQIQRKDYFDGGTAAIGPQIRRMLAEPLGKELSGPVRMLSQPRMWGWLFNPITLYFAWGDDNNRPAGAVLEVTNTPWKERHHYSVPLVNSGDSSSLSSSLLTAEFPKILHVSPFLDLDYIYKFSVAAPTKNALSITIDVVEGKTVSTPDAPKLVLSTKLTLGRLPANKTNLTKALRANPFSTHRVSKGIHSQAARLWRKKVPFVPKQSG